MKPGKQALSKGIASNQGVTQCIRFRMKTTK